MPAPSSDHASSRGRYSSAEYYYRRRLGLRELIPAIGVAIGAGLFAFYVAKVLLQRTPLRIERGPRLATRRARREREARSPQKNPAA